MKKTLERKALTEVNYLSHLNEIGIGGTEKSKVVEVAIRCTITMVDF